MTKLQREARWYVYALSDPRDGAVFYVGKGSGARMHQHEKDAEKPSVRSRKADRIREIVGGGLSVYKSVVAQFWDEQAAYDHETDLIEEIGLVNLTNVLPGGQMAWQRRMDDRATRKLKPLYTLFEKDAGHLLHRFAQWFKAGGHEGSKFSFTANRPEFKIHAELSAFVYNEFMPDLWKQVKEDARALEVFTERIRPFGIEVQHVGA
jgi:hypothetical protein